MDDEINQKRVEVWLQDEDMGIIDAMKRRYGDCTTAAAIRACIRIAAEVKLNLAGSPLIKGD